MIVQQHISYFAGLLEIVFSRTHNLEVLGSSPRWPTLKIKHLRTNVSAFFMTGRPSGDLFEAKLCCFRVLKFCNILWDFT